ncbi:MAG TPA: hypothetical protein DEQ61_24860 [Streptomyces sp.]|nr:hypothetical protein [Streptomyces sp.]
MAGTAGGGPWSGATASESGAGSGTSTDRTEPPAGAAARPGGARRRVLLGSGIVGTLLVVAAAVLLFGFGGEEGDDAKPPPLPPSTTSAQPDPPAGVKCGGETCTGADPEEMGCGGEHARTVGDARVGATFVEVRYSEVCRAAWARITEAAPGDSVRITAGGRTESDKAEPGTGPGDAYTRMVAAEDPADAKACATTVAGQEGCTLPSGTATPERTGSQGTDGTAEPDSGE